MSHPSQYLPRIVDTSVTAAMGRSVALVLEGAKGVGKTETASHQSRSHVLLDVDEDARLAASIDPSLILAGEKPRLIDEWQEVPEIWNHVRRAVDNKEGPFILTGSTVPADDASRHTGAGRFSWIRMRPMSLFELGHSSGTVSLAKLLDGDGTGDRTTNDAGLISVRDLVDIVCVGGWPSLVNSDFAEAITFLQGYLDSVTRTDIRRVDGIARDPQKVWRVLRSLSRNISTEVSNTTIANDVGGSDDPIDVDTAKSYLGALERLMVIEDQPAWAPQIRSRARLRSTPKRHFCDPSLAVAALQLTPSRLLRDLNYFGFLFESLVVRDLRVYAQHSRADVLHYRDNIGEVDIIVEAGERWGAIEVKLGIASVDQAAESLKRFVNRIDVEHRGRPSFLAVVLPTQYSYLRTDGVHVIPIHALGP
jgi:predicted AAA+ superfamily ATPase